MEVITRSSLTVHTLLLLYQARANPIKTITHARTRPEAACLYEDRTYEAGSHFRPDQCTYCHCPRHGGRPRCVVEDCRREPSCVRYERNPGSCCRLCVERGCLDGAGTVYLPEQVVSRGLCGVCVCPQGGGRVECSQVSCPPVSCVDPVRAEGDCCQRCPNGSNCWLGKDVIPAGKIIDVTSCRHCHCPTSDVTSLFGKGPTAVCSSDPCPIETRGNI